MMIKIIIIIIIQFSKKQNQTPHHHLLKSQLEIHNHLKVRPTLHETIFLKKDMQIEEKLSFVCIAKEFMKDRGIYKMKQHHVRVKDDIRPCKSVPFDVKFCVKNSLQEFVKFKKPIQEAYEYEHL